MSKIRVKEKRFFGHFAVNDFCSPKKGLSPRKKNLKIKIKIPLSEKYIRVHYPKILQDLVEN